MKSKPSLFFAFIMGLLLVSCAENSENSATSSKDNASVSGSITSGVGQKLIFEHLMSKGVTALDTITLDEQGKFKFSTEVKGQGFFRVRLAQNNFVVLIMSEGEQIELKSDAKSLDQNYTVNGSAETSRLQVFNQFVNKLYLSSDSLARASKLHQANRDIEGYMGASQFQQILMMKKDKFIRDFVDQNPGSLASLAAVENLNPESDYLYYKKVVDGLKNKIPDSPYFQSLNERVVSWSKTAVGSEAPNISMATPSGGTASLSDLRGKVVLLDFWASWCKPCRAENPNVVRVYNQYRDQGFEVFSVSLDKSQQAWVQAIQQDGLLWENHVSDLKYWQSAAAKLYNVKGIPQTYLLDKEGSYHWQKSKRCSIRTKISRNFRRVICLLC